MLKKTTIFFVIVGSCLSAGAMEQSTEQSTEQSKHHYQIIRIDQNMNLDALPGNIRVKFIPKDDNATQQPSIPSRSTTPKKKYTVKNAKLGVAALNMKLQRAQRIRENNAQGPRNNPNNGHIPWTQAGAIASWQHEIPGGIIAGHS